MTLSADRFEIAYPEPLREVYYCVQDCVYGCCGDDAFDMNAWRLLDWVRANGSNTLIQALDQIDELMDLVAREPHWTYYDKDFEQDGDSFLEHFSLLRVEMLRALHHEQGPAVFDPSWMIPNGGAVEALARQMVDGGRYETAGILADALEEAGCGSPALLTRCRLPKVHASWVVQLLLLGADGVLARPIEPTPGPADSPVPTP